MEPSATSTTVTRPVGERLQAGTADAPVLDRPTLLRRFHDSGAGYKYPDLLTYLLAYLLTVPRAMGPHDATLQASKLIPARSHVTLSYGS